jgi:hypothetical protein
MLLGSLNRESLAKMGRVAVWTIHRPKATGEEMQFRLMELLFHIVKLVTGAARFDCGRPGVIFIAEHHIRWFAA